MKKKQHHDLDDHNLHELECDRRYHATVVSALAERVGAFAGRFAAESLDSNGIRIQEVIALQEAIPRALMELNNAAVAEYDASPR